MATGKPGWFPVFPADLLSDPKHRGLTTEEWGALFLLLCHQWIEGSIPETADEQARYCGCDANVCKRIAFLFVRNADGKLVKRWLDEQREKVLLKRANAQFAASKRWSKNNAEMRTHSERIANAMQIKNKIEIEKENKYTPPNPPCGGGRRRTETVSEDFSTFWSAYPKRVGKKQAWAAWQSLGSDRPSLDVLLAAIEAARRGRAWRDGFVPQPMRWLRDRRWEDEVEPCPPTDAQQAASVGSAQPVGASDAAAESLALIRRAEALGLSVPLWATDDEIQAEIERAESGGLDSP